MSTLTVFPESGAGGGDSIDGWVTRNVVDESFATIIAGAGVTFNETDTGASVNFAGPLLDATVTTDQWAECARIIATFLVGLAAGDTITAATLSVHGTGKGDPTGNGFDMNLYASTPAANNNLVAADYSQIGSTALSDTAITQAGFTNAAYNDFAFNASGLTHLDNNQTGVVPFGFRNAQFDVAAVSPTWNSTYLSYFQFKYADAAGTDNDPKLVITYTPVATGAPWNLPLLGVGN